MPHIIAIEYSEAQRRQLAETLDSLTKSGRPLSAKYEAQTFGTWPELFSSLIQPGLFVSRESFVIEDPDSLGPFPQDLAPLIEDTDSDTVIVLVFTGDTKTLKPIADKITLIKPEPQIAPWKRQSWLSDLAKTEGFSLDPDAAQLLADSIESQEELRGEVLKLGLFAEGRTITVEDVEALSFDEGGRAQMMFLDGLCDNKPQDVARAVKFLREDSPLPVLTAITNRLRPALMLSSFPPASQTDALKASDNDPVKKKYAVNKSRNALKHYGPDRIKRFILGAIRLSFLEKTGRAEGWEGFEYIIWELMAKAGQVMNA